MANEFNFNFTGIVKEDKTYLYRDVNLHFAPIQETTSSSAGDQNIVTNIGVETNEDLQAVFRSLRNIFTWVKGTRILDPEFGVNLRQYVSELKNANTYSEIQREITTAIETYEPRVKIVDINVEDLDPEGHTILVLMRFNIPTLDDQIYNFTIDNEVLGLANR